MPGSPKGLLDAGSQEGHLLQDALVDLGLAVGKHLLELRQELLLLVRVLGQLVDGGGGCHGGLSGVEL